MRARKQVRYPRIIELRDLMFIQMIVDDGSAKSITTVMFDSLAVQIRGATRDQISHWGTYTGLYAKT